MICAMRHVGLVVNNLDNAIAFWCGIMEFIVHKEMEESGKHIDLMLGLNDVVVKTVKLKGPDNSMLELLNFKSHKDQEKWHGEPFSTGFTHIALTVKDIDAIYTKLHQNGLSFAALPQLSPDGKVKAVYARGPENILIELVEEV